MLHNSANWLGYSECVYLLLLPDICLKNYSVKPFPYMVGLTDLTQKPLQYTNLVNRMVFQ